MRRDHKHLDIRTNFAIQDTEGKTWHSTSTNRRGKFDTKPIRMLTYLSHSGFERCKVPRTQTRSLFLIVGNVFKMLNACRIAKEIAHRSKACASRRTSSAEMRLERPLSISSARRAASCSHNCATSSSDRASRLASSCSASSALSRTASDSASRRIASAFMDEIVALLEAGFNAEIQRTPQAIRWNDQLTGVLMTQRSSATPPAPGC